MTSHPSQLLLLAVHLILLSFLLFFYTRTLCSVTKIASPLNNPRMCVIVYIFYSCQSNTRFQFNKCSLIGCTLKSRNVIVVWRSFVQVPPPTRPPSLTTRPFIAKCIRICTYISRHHILRRCRYICCRGGE